MHLLSIMSVFTMKSNDGGDSRPVNQGDAQWQAVGDPVQLIGNSTPSIPGR